MVNPLSVGNDENLDLGGQDENELFLAVEQSISLNDRMTSKSMDSMPKHEKGFRSQGYWSLFAHASPSHRVDKRSLSPTLRKPLCLEHIP